MVPHEPPEGHLNRGTMPGGPWPLPDPGVLRTPLTAPSADGYPVRRRREKTGHVFGFTLIYGVPRACPTGAEDAFFRNIETRCPLGPSTLAPVRGLPGLPLAPTVRSVSFGPTGLTRVYACPNTPPRGRGRLAFARINACLLKAGQGWEASRAP